MQKIEKHHKEIIRYIILALLMVHIALMTHQAYTLELANSLTMQFAGIVALEYPVLTYIIKYLFHTKVSE